MARKYLLVIVLLVLFSSRHIDASQTIVVPITLPIHGFYTFPISGSSGDPDTLNLLDTFTGNITVIASSNRGISSPLWNFAGNKVAFRNGRVGSSIWNLDTASLQSLESFPDRNSLFYPQGWSVDGSQILYRSYTDKSNPRSYQLDLYDLNLNTLQTLFDFEEGELLNDLLPLPIGTNNASFHELIGASWNPVFQDWIIFQIHGYENDTGVIFSILYNRQTGEKFVLDDLLGDGIDINSSIWHSNGEYLFLRTNSGGNSIIKFSNSSNAFEIIESSGEIHGVIDWLGVQDMLLAVGTNSAHDGIFYVAQIINGQWRSTEFFRLPRVVFGVIRNGDWHITASEQEKQTLACLFEKCDHSITGQIP